MNNDHYKKEKFSGSVGGDWPVDLVDLSYITCQPSSDFSKLLIPKIFFMDLYDSRLPN